MAKSETLFSKVFRGFSPEEVVAYIDELSAAHKNAKAESDAKINSLSEELESLKNTGELNASLKSQLDEKDGIIKRRDEEIERLEGDTENQRLVIVEQGDKLAILEKALADAKSEIEAAAIRNAAMEKNSKEYEHMLADVESVLSTARRKAEELISEAEKRASEIVKSAENEAKAKSERIISQSDEHLNENMKKVKYLYRRQDELAEIFRDHKAKVDSFFAALSDASDKK